MFIIVFGLGSVADLARYLRRLIHGAILLSICSICFSHFSCLSMMTPKYLVWSSGFTSMLSTLTTTSQFSERSVSIPNKDCRFHTRKSLQLWVNDDTRKYRGCYAVSHFCRSEFSLERSEHSAKTNDIKVM